MIAPPLDTRRLVGELMDDPGLCASEHRRALRALARLNAWSNASGPIARAIASHGFERTITLLDVATGGGDVMLGCARRLRRAGVRVEVHACDLSDVAIARVRENAQAASLDVRVFPVDARAEGALGSAAYDVVMNALFLHHLRRDDAIGVLRSMGAALRPGGLLIVSDLLRTRLGYSLAWLGSRLLTRSRVVRVDALRSVEAAFSRAELREMARGAGLDGATIRRVWPERAVLEWVKR